MNSDVSEAISILQQCIESRRLISVQYEHGVTDMCRKVIAILERAQEK